MKKTSPTLFSTRRFTVTEDTVFYCLCAVIAPPVIWSVSGIVNPSISPIWGLTCHIISSDSQPSLYFQRTKTMLELIVISSIFTLVSLLLVPNPLLRTLLALVGYLIYKNSTTERLGPYMIGFVNICILTSSPTLGFVGKDTPHAIIHIFRLFGEALVGFFTSALTLFVYLGGKRIIHGSK